MRVDRRWDESAAACSEQHIHLAGVQTYQKILNLEKYLPGGNIESVAAPAEKSMKDKAGEEDKAGRDEEVAEVDKEDGVGE